MGMRDIPPELSYSSIYGFEVSDLVRLAMVLRDIGLTPEDLKESNRVFISGAKYAIDRLNESIGNEIIKSITTPIDDNLADRIKKSSEAVEDIKTAIERISYTLKRSLNNERK